MEEKENIKGVFIPFEIWTIKNLNINEKIILSDIYNKTQSKDFKGYNKKIETIMNDFFLKEDTAKDILNTLQKKGYIKSFSEVYRNNGNFKKSFPNRKILNDNFINAKRFIIPNDNIFFKNGENGVFLLSDDIFTLNNWFKEKDGKKVYSDVKTRFLILLMIIKKIAFVIDWEFAFLFARFTIEDISFFMGMTRKTVSKYIKELTEKRVYKDKKIRIIYKLSDDEVYQELCEELGGFKILTKENQTFKDLKNLYYINIEALLSVGIYFYKE